jgi:hypothetical protein
MEVLNWLTVNVPYIIGGIGTLVWIASEISLALPPAEEGTKLWYFRTIINIIARNTRIKPNA